MTADAVAPGPSGDVRDPWERAYLAFETPQEELRKFARRLRRLGAASWPRDTAVVEMFCGRGTGLRALERLGFERLVGVDLSSRLLRLHPDGTRRIAGDCRRLPLATASQDVLIVQGGLHHLPRLDDLSRCLDEVRRALRPGGRFAAVEPWDTPFLRMVHAVCDRPVARRLSPRVDALAAMIELERPVYHDWLAAGPRILGELDARFAPELRLTRWGKLVFLGRRRD